MKNIATISGLVLFLLLGFNCKKKICHQCIKCISYDANFDLINEVRECNIDTLYLGGFKEGFVEGAEDQGWSAICVDLGLVCERK